MKLLPRKTALVRLHLRDDDRSFEGIFTGYLHGHYRLENAKLMLSADASHEVGKTWVPKERVLFVQEIES